VAPCDGVTRCDSESWKSLGWPAREWLLSGFSCHTVSHRHTTVKTAILLAKDRHRDQDNRSVRSMDPPSLRSKQQLKRRSGMGLSIPDCQVCNGIGCVSRAQEQLGAPDTYAWCTCQHATLARERYGGAYPAELTRVAASQWQGTRAHESAKAEQSARERRDHLRPQDPRLGPRCGAKIGSGRVCEAPGMPNGRCRLHGGMSTGPKTGEGKDRIRKARTKHGRYSAANKLVRPEGPPPKRT
jgi:hypothetical protein